MELTEDLGPRPRGRLGHAMAASDGRRIFVLGGELSPGAQPDDAKFIYVLNTSIHFLSVHSLGLL